MARIFISYRRDDASGHAGWLRDALAAEFGAAEIFRDINTIAPGEHFVRAMTSAVESCSVFLAVIGRQWLTVVDAEGKRRLDDPDDHVRREIAEALARGVRVIPVLVQSARMPDADVLPEPLKDLASRNAIALDDDDWQTDVQRLVSAIRRDVPVLPVDDVRVRGGRFLKPRYAVAAAGGVLALAWLVFLPGPPDAAESTDDPAAAAPLSNLTPASPAAADPPSGEVSAASTQATLPRGGEVSLGPNLFEVFDARVNANADGASTLVVRMRLTNRSRYDVGFGDAQFRLLLNGQTHAPANRFAEAVAAETSREGTVTFDIPRSATAGTLQISAADETADVLLDLTGREGATADADRRARQEGSAVVPVPIDAAPRQMRFADVICEFRSASAHRYVNKLTLTLDVRLYNRGSYDTTFGDSHFRLLLDGEGRAPVSGLSTVVSAEASKDGKIVFDLPLEARQAIVRVRYGDDSAELPLALP